MKEKIEFPLLQLPHDVIRTTSFFLNEENIINFERCCRLFYQMINDACYLNQTNNFKTFILDDKKLDEICDWNPNSNSNSDCTISKSKYSFFKYSKADTLDIRANPYSCSVIVSYDSDHDHDHVDHHNEQYYKSFDLIKDKMVSQVRDKWRQHEKNIRLQYF